MSTDSRAATFAGRLRDARRLRGYTQEQLARMADVSISMVRDLEQSRRMPGLRVLSALARALGYTVTELIGE